MERSQRLNGNVTDNNCLMGINAKQPEAGLHVHLSSAPLLRPGYDSLL